MVNFKNKPVRYVVDLDAIKKLDDQALPASNQVEGEGYSPVLQTPNFFRKLYGYTVYQKDAKSAF
jgi:hypothetical protein